MLEAGWQVAQPPKYRMLILITSLLCFPNLAADPSLGDSKTSRLLGLAQA